MSHRKTSSGSQHPLSGRQQRPYDKMSNGGRLTMEDVGSSGPYSPMTAALPPLNRKDVFGDGHRDPLLSAYHDSFRNTPPSLRGHNGFLASLGGASSSVGPTTSATSGGSNSNYVPPGYIVLDHTGNAGPSGDAGSTTTLSAAEAGAVSVGEGQAVSV